MNNEFLLILYALCICFTILTIFLKIKRKAIWHEYLIDILLVFLLTSLIIGELFEIDSLIESGKYFAILLAAAAISEGIITMRKSKKEQSNWNTASSNYDEK